MRLSLVILLGVLGLASGRADAYPQFQLSTGADRCSACHFSPAGGGLINDYGRDEAGSISGGGDGRFLHGAWTPPSWLQLGVDTRGALGVKYRKEEREVLAFPMQLDVYVRAGGERISFNLTAGLRGGARDPQPPLVERLASREHYLMYQRESGSYVRVGRFFPIHGIRSPCRPGWRAPRPMRGSRAVSSASAGCRRRRSCCSPRSTWCGNRSPTRPVHFATSSPAMPE